MKTLTKEFHPAIQRYIEHSNVENRDTRYSFVKSLFDKFEDENKKVETKSKFKDIVEEIGSEKKVQTVVKNIPELKDKIALETIDFVKKADNEIKKAIYNEKSDEIDLYNEIQEIEFEQFYENKTDKRYRDLLKKIIPWQQVTRFYDNLSDKAGKNHEEKKHYFEIFKDDMKSSIDKNTLDIELKVLEELRKPFLSELYKKIDAIQKLYNYISPFTKDLGRFWDKSEGLWQNIDFDILENYNKLFKNDPTIQELAELLGRLKDTQKEIEEVEFRDSKIIQKPKINPYFKEEIIGVKESDDINHLLPTEIGLLSKQSTKSIFFKKYSEKKLQTFDFHSIEKEDVEKEFLNKKESSKEKNKGPFIVCVDTSGSMNGTPENIAKMITFAILKIAQKENRKAYLISFSTSIKTLDLTNIENTLEKIVSFLSMSFHGGTDNIPAIKEAIQMTNKDDYKDADVLMISDFIMPSLDEDTKKLVEIAKAKKTKFYSLSITNNSNENILNEFDENWIYNTNDMYALKKLVTNLKKISN